MVNNMGVVGFYLDDVDSAVDGKKLSLAQRRVIDCIFVTPFAGTDLRLEEPPPSSRRLVIFIQVRPVSCDYDHVIVVRGRKGVHVVERVGLLSCREVFICRERQPILTIAQVPRLYTLADRINIRLVGKLVVFACRCRDKLLERGIRSRPIVSLGTDTRKHASALHRLRTVLRRDVVHCGGGDGHDAVSLVYGRDVVTVRYVILGVQSRDGSLLGLYDGIMHRLRRSRHRLRSRINLAG